MRLWKSSLAAGLVLTACSKSPNAGGDTSGKQISPEPIVLTLTDTVTRETFTSKDPAGLLIGGVCMFGLGGANTSDAKLGLTGSPSSEAVLSGKLNAMIALIDRSGEFQMQLTTFSQADAKADMNATSGSVALTLGAGRISGTITSDLRPNTLSVDGALRADCYAAATVDGGPDPIDPTFSSPRCQPYKFLLAPTAGDASP